MISFLIAFFLPQAFAARDSVAVFHRPDKVIVQINEAGSNSRLQQLLNAFHAQTDLLWLNNDESIRFNCGRGPSGATCMIRLLPSSSVIIEPKSATGQAFGVPASDLELEWESSNRQRFTVKILNGELVLKGQKP